MKRQILDFSVMKEEISQNNVLEMSELIAFMELRFQIGYSGKRAQKMYADLYGGLPFFYALLWLFVSWRRLAHGLRNIQTFISVFDLFFLYSRGVLPVIFLKYLEKCDESKKPHSCAI